MRRENRNRFPHWMTTRDERLRGGRRAARKVGDNDDELGVGWNEWQGGNNRLCNLAAAAPGGPFCSRGAERDGEAFAAPHLLFLVSFPPLRARLPQTAFAVARRGNNSFFFLETPVKVCA